MNDWAQELQKIMETVATEVCVVNALWMLFLVLLLLLYTKQNKFIVTRNAGIKGRDKRMAAKLVKKFPMATPDM